MSSTVPLPPNAERMINSMRALGYSFQTALADVIDNSISAGATTVSILTSPDPEEEQFLAVLDNGSGMNYSGLVESMRHAGKGPSDKRNANDLGRFGLGMKTASLSQCRQLYVVSKLQGEINAVGWLIDTVARTNDWTLTVFDRSEYIKFPCFDLLTELETGTLLIWKDFDTLKAKNGNVYDGLLDELSKASDHLALVYHRFLNDDEFDEPMHILVNGREIAPKDPFLENRRGGADAFPAESVFIEGFPDTPIVVTGYTLPHQNKISQSQFMSLGLEGRTLGDDQGFYIYRGKRLIYWGDWLRMTRKAQASKLCRVKVDVPSTMDSIWELDIKKSKATPPKIVRDRLAEYLTLLMSKSCQIQSGKGARVRRSSNPEYPVWEPSQIGINRYKVSINRSSPVFLELYESMDRDQRKLFVSYLMMLESFYPARWVASQYQDDRSSLQCDEDNGDVKSEFKKLIRLLLQFDETDEGREELVKMMIDNADTADSRVLIEKVLKELNLK